MDTRELYDVLLTATSLKDAETALASWRKERGTKISEVPVGKRPNNRGAIEIASDPARSLIERVTNAFDALLELEHQEHGGKPECRSPREAASAWVGGSLKDGLAGLTIKERQDLAATTVG